MHLVLGHRDDACSAGVLARLRERGLSARLVTDPLASPARLEWRLDNAGVQSRIAFDGADAAAISSVLVRDAGGLDPAGWDPTDYAYMQAETRAALLAWLASLPCPVVNRASAALWYRPCMPLLAWRTLLRRGGLPTPEMLLTNDPAQARDFGRRLEADGAGGAVFAPLGGSAVWLVGASDWPQVAAFQQRAPVCLAEPHGRAQLACVVGTGIVWDAVPSTDAAALAPRLLRFAESASLGFVEVAIAPVRGGQAVVLVEPRVRLEHFRDVSRERILDALVRLLVGEAAAVPRAVEEVPR